VDVLHRDLLLALAAMSIERVEQRRIGAGELALMSQNNRNSMTIIPETYAGKWHT
jgi:hypothetical protein